MVKRAAATAKPAIVLDTAAPLPVYRQIYDWLRRAIVSGQLEPGARLPSTRVLASELGVSRSTTALAYEQLVLEGYLEGKVGHGTRVAKLQPEQIFEVGGTGRRRQQWSTQPLAQGGLARRGQLLAALAWQADGDADQTGAVANPFRVGQPDVDAFPYDLWARLLTKHARQSLHGVARDQRPQGHGPLREAIAAHIGITRGVHCTPEQIILTAGAQGALDLIARVLLDPGDSTWVEEPGYFGTTGALLGAGAVLVPVPVEGDGLAVEVGRQRCPEARLAVVTPSHQCPTGVTMSRGRRLALLEWAGESGAWIVEDDYDSEYRYGGRPLEALHGLDRAGRVIYVGTFSKVLLPSLRLGYLVAPPALVEGLLAARRLIDRHLPLLEQLALTDFLAEGHFARHLRRMRLRYLERRDALVESLRRELADAVEVSVPEAGMHLVAWLPPGVSGQTIATAAARQGLRVPTIAQFCLEPPQRDGLMLGFASATPEGLREGVRRLASGWRTQR